MDYETALKLKKAGFPIIEHADRSPESREYIINSTKKEIVYVPTLPELVEACKGNLYQLQWGLLNEVTARGAKDNLEKAEIALANLWLAINKK